MERKYIAAVMLLAASTAQADCLQLYERYRSNQTQIDTILQDNYDRALNGAPDETAQESNRYYIWTHQTLDRLLDENNEIREQMKSEGCD